MLHHAAKLIIQSFRSSFVAIGTTWLGLLLGLLVALIGVALPLFRAWPSNGWAGVRNRWTGETAAAIGWVLAAAVVVYAPTFAYFFCATAYGDHMSLVAQNGKLVAENAHLNSQLEWHTHNISTRDPVFPNIIYLLQAFAVFRGQMKGTPCVMYITAPPKATPLASTVAQFSNSVSGCSTFGPDGTGNEDIDRLTLDGMVPDAIVVHAPRGDVAADNLVMSLANEITVRRSYRLMPNPQLFYSSTAPGADHLVWLQFGADVEWRSELKAQRK